MNPRSQKAGSDNFSIGRFFRVLLLYIFLGPPLGSLVYLIGLGLRSGAPNGIGDLIQSYLMLYIPIGLIVGYPIGIVPAALAGVIVAAIDAATRFRFTTTLLLVVASSLPSTILLLAVGAGTSAENPLIWINWPNTLLKSLTCIVPTVVVWLILQRWRRVSIAVPRRVRVPQ